ncbi:MAG: hypothetical protein ACE5OQ_10935 [Woeseia sp.]
MNARNVSNIEEQQFAAKAKELFDRSVQGLDAETQSRLNRGRHEALEQLRPGVDSMQWLRWTSAAGVAAAAVVAVMILSSRPPVDDLAPPGELSDFEILMTEESLEMLEELEFYSWIDLEAQLDDELDTNGNVG